MRIRSSSREEFRWRLLAVAGVALLLCLTLVWLFPNQGLRVPIVVFFCAVVAGREMRPSSDDEMFSSALPQKPRQESQAGQDDLLPAAREMSRTDGKDVSSVRPEEGASRSSEKPVAQPQVPSSESGVSRESEPEGRTNAEEAAGQMLKRPETEDELREATRSAERHGWLVEAHFWAIKLKLAGAQDGQERMDRYCRKWFRNGCHKERGNPSKVFTEEDASFSRAVMRIKGGFDAGGALLRLRQLNKSGNADARQYLKSIRM